MSSTVYRIDHVVSHVYRLALLDFTNSCAAFIEMLDRDSTLLRVDTQAALRIVRYSGEEDGRGNYKRGKGEKERGERGLFKETRMRERLRVCVRERAGEKFKKKLMSYYILFVSSPRPLHSEQGRW